MKSYLFNKTVVITGGNGGLGFSLAKKLILRFNCKIIAIARNEEKFLKCLDELGDKKDNFTYKIFDVCSLSAWQDFYGFLISKNITPDILINNAGFMLEFMNFSRYSFEQINSIVNTNFLSVVYATKTLLPLLKKSSFPTIINISSSAGLNAVVGQSMYSATKFAVRGFTDSLRVENKDFYVCGVYPGFIKTDILSKHKISEKELKLVNKFMMPLDKATNKIIRKIKAKRKNIILGIDGKYLSFGGRFCPIASSKLTAKVLKSSKLEMFENIFNIKGE